MFKRELKINLKSFIIWSSVLIGMFLIVFLIYPSIISSQNVNMIDDMMKLFPPEILKVFNMDISSIDSVFGWLKTEGFVFVLLLTGIYSGMLGSSILLKEESDKTIEYLNSLPVKRNNIVISKMSCALFYIFLMILIVGLFNYIGLSLSGDFDKTAYVLLSFTPLFSSFTIFFICLFISTFFHKTKKTIGISLGFVFMSYFLQMISEISESVRALKYLSVFSLADIRNVIINETINPVIIVITLFLSLLFFILTIVHYNKKELI